MNVLNKLTQNIYEYPVRWASFIRACFLLASAFGMHLTSDQLASLMLVVESGLMVFTHQNVTPLSKLP